MKMGISSKIEVAPPLTQDDQEWLRTLWLSEWGGETMVSKGKTHYFQDLDAVIAWADDVRVGAATYNLENDGCELMSINAIVEGLGAGSALISAVEQAVHKVGVGRIWLITSNDNLDALRFYQRRGYRITAVYPDAIDEARKLKPTIPQIGYYEIPIHDEVELEKFL
ncbi:acetyltransferase [Ferroacidibacillus organovorans]|uniref:Acetyltransferase n=3 Tax=Ferroacidibacillus organovorans TaxID=1765683 RepID=A0A117SY13_9BACL|nr:acetyltransferase [Ferroacidibacillus organovorans]KYP79348.1 acetyltransferase [Ferroacidibacillus organovorans]OAG88372.1 acetyltransferase [Ferroacidibacillus organovorans]OPG14870.1 N-acetyltransferase [Ferroacidibacillus organovorans]